MATKNEWLELFETAELSERVLLKALAANRVFVEYELEYFQARVKDEAARWFEIHRN